MDMIFESQQQMEEALVYWQRLLRLQDWDITIRHERAVDMPHEGQVGANHMFWPKRQATIRILDSVDYPTDNQDNMQAQDQLLTLVHELLHLHVEPLLNGWEDRECRYNDEELCIERTAEALVTLWRQCHPVAPKPSA